MNHYFTNNPENESNRKNINFRFLALSETFISDDNVFSKDTLDYGSRVLLEMLVKEDIQGKVLDLGCGIGPIGILLKKYKEIDLVMSDINERAVELARSNSELYHQNNRVILSDAFDNIDDIFDVIVTNPPIRTGKQNIYHMFKESLDHLKPDGKLYIVIQKKQGAESAIKYLTEFGHEIFILEKNKGYWIIKVQKRIDK